MCVYKGERESKREIKVERERERLSKRDDDVVLLITEKVKVPSL